MTIWRPFTQEKVVPSAIKITKGDGLYLYDERGRKYADLISSWWVNLHGHANKEIAAAISEQAKTLEHVIFTAFCHQPAETVVQNLQTVLPKNLDKFFFSDNGSTAVEVALKMAYQFFTNQGITKRKIYLHLEGSYHGDTYGAMSVSGKNSMYHFHFSDFFFDTISVAVPEYYDGVENLEEKEDKIIFDLENQLEQMGDTVCALIVEPLLQGARGMVEYRPEFLEKLVKTVRKFGILVIFDEVMTGFYRTGRFFAMDYLSKMTPDIICLSKGLTGGFLPLSLTVATSRIYNAFLSDDFNDALIHGHSYTANPIACAAACKSFEILTRKETLENIRKIEDIHRTNEVFGTQKRRTLGTVSAFDLPSSEVANQLATKLFEKGIFVRPLGKTIYLIPPYCILPDELRNVYFEINSALREILR
ncbi:MAG: adenosylmethionine--8-amino-7-oxononanoate transaminase [Alphaproteobacteria bacterium]|nr:adenosylmethionine--8-amino-7-oxononanoate transaminase [Alphaproteobacteria bacterium]